MKMEPVTIAAAVALACVGWVLFKREPVAEASGGDEIGTGDGEGGWSDLPGLLSAAQSFVTPGTWNNPDSLSPEGLQALMRREGFSATPYPDHKGYSIGYGHLIKPGESLQSVTRAEAAELLAADVAWAVDAVRSAVTAPLNQDQFDALVSFAFNVGAGAFRRSTLVRRINAYDQNAGDEFARWVYASGVVNDGLVARREGERDQFNQA